MQKNYLFQFIPDTLNYLTNQKTLKYKEKNLKCDYLINIVHELILKYIFTHDTEFNLWSEILKKKYGKFYNYYINWLVEKKVIFLVSNYYSGKKARTYRLNIKDINIIRCKVYDKIIVNKSKKELLNRTFTQMSNSPIPEDIRQILVDDLSFVKLDYANALKYLKEEYNSGRIDQKKYLKNLNSIENINYNYIFFKFDVYGRMHTNFTNLKTEIRNNYLTIDGDKISEVDVQNSQPLFFSKLLSDELEPENMNDELIRFIELTKNGLIYDDFVNRSENITTRKDAKLIFYKVFFGYNNGKEADQIFKKLYPTVYEYIEEYKSLNHSYKQFSHTLQKLESKFIFENVVRTLKTHYPQIKIFTIHDSICFPERYKIEVNLVFNNCFKNYFD